MSKTEKRKRPRTCIACGNESPKKELLRVVRNKNGVLSYDSTGRADGRGAYVCKDIKCVELAEKRKSFLKALGVQPDVDLFKQLAEACNEGR